MVKAKTGKYFTVFGPATIRMRCKIEGVNHHKKKEV
jgi:hypothetical protein